LTNYENFVAETGDYLGTEINSDRMLWSMAGNLAMVHRVFIGMNFETNGIRFLPTVPRVYAGKRVLSNFKYRKAILQITVKGFGKNIKSFKIDGKKQTDFFFPADLVGKHKIEIELDNQSFDKDNINLVKNEFSLPTPSIMHTKDLDYLKQGYTFYFAPPVLANEHNVAIYENGKFLMFGMEFRENEYPDIKFDKPKNYKEYTATVAKKNKIESFSCEPILHIPQNASQQIQLETILPASSLAYTNYTGKGFVEISTTENRSIEIPIEVEKEGNYYIRFRYANGSGAWNTDNSCALRSLYVNGEYRGAMVFPQRGTNEWSDWGFSNGYQINLKAGENKIRLSFEEWNNNMNVDVNRAMLDCVEVIRID
jgi:hypothetical protein